MTHNKSVAVTVLSILEKDKLPGILAIVDADFDLLEGKPPASPNLLFTDGHDLEIMLLQSSAFDHLLAELGSEEKIARFRQKCGKDLRFQLLELAMHIGYLRWISLRENLSLKFEGLDFDKFIDRERLTLDSVKLLRTVQSRSAKTILPDAASQQKIEQLKSDTHDALHICCGHDVIDILALGLRKALGNHNTQTVTRESIEMSLRLAYWPDSFFKTNLYASIKHWEDVNTPFVVLASVTA